MKSQRSIIVLFALLLVSVGALVTVVAHDSRQPINLSECGEHTKVFVRPVSYGDRVFAVDLPAGVYLAKMIAVGDVDLGRVAGRYERLFKVTVRSWLTDRENLLALRKVLGGEFTEFGGFIFTPGGTALLSVDMSPDSPEHWRKSAAWFLEVYALGVCEPPEQGFSPTRPSEATDLAALETR